MSEARNQQDVIVSLMDDTLFGTNLEFPYMDDEPSTETRNSRGEVAGKQTKALDQAYLIQNCDSIDSVPRVSGNLTDGIEEFIVGLRRYDRNIYGEELTANSEKWFRQILPSWNKFLQPELGVRCTSAVVSPDIKEDLKEFIPWLEAGTQWTEDNEEWIKIWLPRWNTFLQARAGETLVTCWNLCLTIVGFIFYMVDQVSDIGTSMYYASKGQWWQAMVILTIVYGAVIIHTVAKWADGQIHCISSADWLRYVASLLVNWPDVKQYGTLCLLERKLHQSPEKNAGLVPEWRQKRLNVVYLKFMEGVWEACPQAILQLCLLIPDLDGDWTWAKYLRIATVYMSLSTAGAALINWEKQKRILNYIDLPLSELVVLLSWAVPVTVSRLLSVTLLLTMHPYWALVGVALHLVLYGIHYCCTVGVPCTVIDVIYMCLGTLLFCISPFDVAWSIIYRRVYHAIHFLGNTAMTVVWALHTPLVCAHPALYITIICFNIMIFAVGLLGWQIHEKKWPGSYL